MKITRIYFERTKSLPGFHNKKIGIEIQLEKGDRADEALKEAENFVGTHLGDSISAQPDQPEETTRIEQIEGEVEDGNDLPF